MEYSLCLMVTALDVISKYQQDYSLRDSKPEGCTDAILVVKFSHRVCGGVDGPGDQLIKLCLVREDWGLSSVVLLALVQTLYTISSPGFKQDPSLIRSVISAKILPLQWSSVLMYNLLQSFSELTTPELTSPVMFQAILSQLNKVCSEISMHLISIQTWDSHQDCHTLLLQMSSLPWLLQREWSQRCSYLWLCPSPGSTETHCWDLPCKLKKHKV